MTQVQLFDYPEAIELMKRRDRETKIGNFAAAKAEQHKLVWERARELKLEIARRKRRRRKARGRRA